MGSNGSKEPLGWLEELDDPPPWLEEELEELLEEELLEEPPPWLEEELEDPPPWLEEELDDPPPWLEELCSEELGGVGMLLWLDPAELCSWLCSEEAEEPPWLVELCCWLCSEDADEPPPWLEDAEDPPP